LAPEPLESAPDAASRRACLDAFREGTREIAPAVIANSVWGLVTGVAMVKSGMSVLMALVITVIVYSGTMQLMVMPLLAVSAPLWLVFMAGFMVNARFVIFNAGLYPFFRDRPAWQRMAVGFFNADAAFAIYMARYGDSPTLATPEQRWFYAGMIVPCWVTWEAFSIAGIYLSTLVPVSWSLEFAASLAILAIVVPMTRTRPMLATVLSAGVVAWVGQILPLRLGLLAAVVVGIVAGMLVERHQHRARA
jgi:predicted branched-subunit amino acid permease